MSLIWPQECYVVAQECFLPQECCLVSQERSLDRSRCLYESYIVRLPSISKLIHSFGVGGSSEALLSTRRMKLPEDRKRIMVA